MHAAMEPISQVVEHSLSITRTLYKRFQIVKSNKRSCEKLLDRTTDLMRVLEALQEQEDFSHASDLVRRSLKKLQKILGSAEELVDNHDDSGLLQRTLRATSLKESFESLDRQMDEVVQLLSLSLQVRK